MDLWESGFIAFFIGGKLWEEHKDAVIARLEKTYGETDEGRVFEDRLVELAKNIAHEYSADLIPDMAYAMEGSRLDETDEYTIEVRLRDTLADSGSMPCRMILEDSRVVNRIQLMLVDCKKR